MTGNRFEGEVVLVTGASTGVGAVAAHRFAAEGAKVALVGRTEATLRRTAAQAPAGGVEQPVPGDVTDPAVIAETIASVVATWGRLDVLVNNASTFVTGSVEEVTLEQWRHVMALDVDSVFYASRAAMPHLRAARGSIVNVGSVSALRGDWDQAAYNAAKGAMVQLTNAMALDHGEHVRVNAVHPGPTVVNDATRAVFAEGSPVLRLFQERIPSRRVAQPEEVADVIVFLASSDARGVNGVHVPVDGGLTASNGQPSQAVARALAEEFFASASPELRDDPWRHGAAPQDPA